MAGRHARPAQNENPTDGAQAPLSAQRPSRARKTDRTQPTPRTRTTSRTADRARATLRKRPTTSARAQMPLSSRRGASQRYGGEEPVKKRDALSTLLIAVGVVLLLVAGFLWGQSRLRYMKQDKINKELASYVTVKDTELDSEKSEPPEVDWAGLKAVNDDVVGWLQVPGTTINYPVYQAEDNDYYLRTSATGEWSIGGQLFLDYENAAPGMVDQISQIYGHHLLDGTMFEQIAAMDDQARFDEIKTVWYVTESAAYECQPLFLYYTTPDDGDARIFKFENDEEFRTYLRERLNRAVTKCKDSDIIVSGSQHVLTLVTCNYYDGYGRTILVCVPKADAEAAIKVSN